MKLKFKPFGTNVIVKAPIIEDKTESGVILSESMIKEKQEAFDGYYEVLAIGNDVKEVTIGDKVMIKNGVPQPTIIDDIPCLVVYVGSIVGKRL